MLKKIVPNTLKKTIKKILKPSNEKRLKIKINEVRKTQKRLVSKLKAKKIINVVFLVIHDSVWKYDSLYDLLRRDKRFNPVIVIVPLVREGVPVMEVYNRSLNHFQENNYQVFSTFSNATNSWLDIKDELEVDIVFFTNPHKLTFDKYYIHHFLDRLTCYVPYSFQVSFLYQEQYNQQFHNLIWQCYYETEYHFSLAKKFAVNKGANVVVTGYPGLDNLFDFHNYTEVKSCPKSSLKHIIWAPHHTINGQGNKLDYSCFLEYASDMMEFAEEYCNDVYFTFKPHPILKEKLYQEETWGKDKTDEYYQFWESRTNSQLAEGNYDKLFIDSDAMIHDSGSFLAEYLTQNKPALFTVAFDGVFSRFNDVGLEALECHYHAYNKKDIREFIEMIIKMGPDKLMEERIHFREKYLTYYAGRPASDNIYISLNHTLNRKECAGLMG